MPFGIEMHHLYMAALMLLVFMIGFVVLAGPNVSNKTFAVLSLSPAVAVLIDVKFVPNSFWTIYNEANPGFLILGCVAYFFALIAGIALGIGWRHLKHFDHIAIHTD